MGLFTLRRLASLQSWFAATASFGLGYWIGLKIFVQKIDCKLDGPGQKCEVEESCMGSIYSSYQNSSDISEIRYYDINARFLWTSLLLLSYFCIQMWTIYENKRHPEPNKSAFSRASALAYVITSFILLSLAFTWFQFTVSDAGFAGFAIAWLQNFSDGKPLLAREVTCELRTYRLFEPVTTTATCRLPMNSHFEFIYLVLWFWFALLAVFNLLVLLDCLLYAFSSTLRLKRLSALLKGVNKQKIFALAQNADDFFKIECCAGETVELKGQQLLDVAPRD